MTEKYKPQFLYTGSSKDLTDHEKYIKFGGTKSIKNRLDTYITSYSINPFQFESVFEINTEMEFKTIEKNITEYLNNTQTLGGMSGTEWYERTILNTQFIIEKLKELEIDYRLLRDEEINALNRKSYKKHPKKTIIKLVPRDYQEETLTKLIEYYKSNDIANLLWPCGIGKTFEGLYVTKNLGAKKILICAPSIHLLNQWGKTISELFPELGLVVPIGGDSKTCLTRQILNRKSIIILCTYHSVHRIYKLQEKYSETYFDFKIGDEAHHLVGKESISDRQFKVFHTVTSKKTLFLTATKKIVENNLINNESTMYSMDNDEQFGKTVDEKTVLWAIENKYLVDYSLIDIVNTQEEINEIMESLNIIHLMENSPHKNYIINLKNRDKIDELFLSAYISLKEISSISELNKLLVYTNTTQHADIIKYFINIIIESNIFKIDKNEFYFNDLHSNRDDIDINVEISKFQQKNMGIVSCVQIFGEGYNYPGLDGVVFAEKMESEIRIIQSILRPHRINPEKPCKKAYVLIPRIDFEEADEEGKDREPFKKIEQIGIYLRNIDENVYSKIKSQNIAKRKNKKRETYKSKNVDNKTFENEIIGQIRTRIRLAGNMKLTLSKFCQILKDNSVFNNEEYHRFLDKGKEMLPRFITKSFPEFSWDMVDPESKIYYTKSECIEKINELYSANKAQIKSLKYPRKKIKFLSELDEKIPNKTLWTYYNGEQEEFSIF